MYDYRETMVSDIKEAIRNNAEYEAHDLVYNRDDFEQRLYDDLWTDDSVTGNASGSYFCNSYKAKECVTDNEELCKEALTEFCESPENIADHFLSGDWEYFDVTIRCYLLGECISVALDELVAELEEE